MNAVTRAADAIRRQMIYPAETLLAIKERPAPNGCSSRAGGWMRRSGNMARIGYTVTSPSERKLLGLLNKHLADERTAYADRDVARRPRNMHIARKSFCKRYARSASPAISD